MRKSCVALAAAAGAFSALGAANADAGTVITFADPSPDATSPMFEYNSGLLSGGWNSTGLNLLTPGLAAPDYLDATFTMSSPVLSVIDLGVARVMSGGTIDFFDSIGNPILTITFGSAILSFASSLGASDFVGQDVVFSGAVLGGETMTNEAFSFSFANPVGNAERYVVTASFTSSADVLPAPGTLALAGVALMLGARRRR